MSISKNEVNRAFRVSSNGFNLSAFTALELHFVDPNGVATTKTNASSNPVSAPAVVLSDDEDLGDQAASTYFEFKTIAGDFSLAGAWTVCGVYKDATGSVFSTEGSPMKFNVLESCL